MKGDPTMLQHLNKVLRNELTAINQYFLHSRMLGNWGVHRLAHYEYGESIDEMRHADELIERILFLDGLPNLQDLDKLRIGEHVREVLECDMALEQVALPDLRAAIAHAEQIQDYGSREVLVRILHSEEEHVDWLERQFDLIRQTGLENYISQNSRKDS